MPPASSQPKQWEDAMRAIRRQIGKLGQGARALDGLVARRTTKASFFALFLIDDEVRWAPNHSTVLRLVAIPPIQRALPDH
jgi:hypothetical protein